MKNKLISIILLLTVFMAVGNAQPNVPPQMQRSGEIKLVPMRGMENHVMVYNPFGNRNMKARGGFSPLFMLIPDKPCNESEAMNLFKELGLDQLAKEYSGGLGIINPVGKTWNNKIDFEAYKVMIDSMRIISNLKLIAIGRGATFVNQTIANNASEIAGIVSINGKPGKVSRGAVPVPAFISGKNAVNVAKSYIAVNKATLADEGTDFTTYINQLEPLQQVVVNNKQNQTNAEVIKDAWQTVLSKNYRFNNYKHTFYMGAKFGQYGAYELEPYVMFKELGIQRNVVEQDLLQTGTFLWYEYLPKGVQNAKAKSVPLVLLLHGHGNDPRTQSETSGWIEVAAKENIFVAELEWQGNGYAPMGLDGIEMVVYELLRKYPQIDPERIYTEGLSAGAMTSTALGIRKSHLFAGIGAMSGGLFPGGFYQFSGEALMNEAIQKRACVEVAYFNVDGTDDDTIMYPTVDTWKGNSIINAWTIYQTINDIKIMENYDFKSYPTFGQLLANQKTEIIKGMTVESGELFKGKMPLMKIVAVQHYGHWNFKPAAQMMWDFLKHYSRDSQTKKLIYHP